jgi:hypothetical protein
MIKNINEYKVHTSLNEQELMEMVNASEKITGIKNVVILFHYYYT